MTEQLTKQIKELKRRADVVAASKLITDVKKEIQALQDKIHEIQAKEFEEYREKQKKEWLNNYVGAIPIEIETEWSYNGNDVVIMIFEFKINSLRHRFYVEKNENDDKERYAYAIDNAQVPCFESVTANDIVNGIKKNSKLAADVFPKINKPTTEIKFT